MRAYRRNLRVLLGVFISAIGLTASVMPVAAANASSSPAEMTRLGTRMYFAATTVSHGRELWTSDGTAAGTHEVKDINPTGGSDPVSLTVVDNRLFFEAWDGANTRLWVSDGTEIGTIPLSQGFVIEPLNAGGTLFFLRDMTVWKSNGTVGGTDPVETVPGDAVAGGYDGWRSAAVYQGAYYFFVDPDENGNEPWELWRSDGTPAGTEMVDSLASEREPTEMVVSGGLLYMNLLEGGGGTISPGDLWKSDGTAAGTKQVKDLAPGDDVFDADGVGDLTNVAGTLYFSIWNSEVWRSNGTAAGTRRLKLFDGGTGHRMVLSRLMNKLLFSGPEFALWRSKGTKSSTVLVNGTGPYACSTSAVPDPGCDRNLNYKPVAAGSLLFYPAKGAAGIELWASDGTNAGTHLVKNIGPGTNHSRPSDLAAFGTKVVFVAKDGTHGRELWISDGTASGTKMVKDINPG